MTQIPTTVQIMAGRQMAKNKVYKIKRAQQLVDKLAPHVSKGAGNKIILQRTRSLGIVTGSV